MYSLNKKTCLLTRTIAVFLYVYVLEEIKEHVRSNVFKTNVIYSLCADVCKHDFNIQYVLFEAYIPPLGIIVNDKIRR